MQVRYQRARPREGKIILVLLATAIRFRMMMRYEPAGLWQAEIGLTMKISYPDPCFTAHRWVFRA